MENVTGLLKRGFGDILRDLAALGYDAEWEVLPASAFGACHKRERVFIVAYPSGKGLEGCWPSILEFTETFKGNPREILLSESTIIRSRNDVPCYVDRIRGLGNAVVPKVAEIIGRAIMKVEGGTLNGH